MTRDLQRFLDQDDRAASYLRLFGNKEALDNVRDLPNDERVDGLVREYCKSLKKHCKFSYVSSCAVLSPDRNEIKYFLVFATNYHRGIEVFKDAESKANNLQESIKMDKKEQAESEKRGCDNLFSMASFSASPFLSSLREKYRSKAKVKLLEKLKTKQNLSYMEAFCCTMAFPLFGKDDLRNLITNEPSIDLVLDKSKKPNRKAPSCDEEDFVVIRKAT
ncbi:hypothetical protein N9868_00875 [Akkermansiaceae bacterium]|nr:hypothetical protein [Akkermansiaceae bacterium]MDB4288779.1 hypothetical protein [bacterium]MDA7648943.1 hypothetical protein [Akkermansiaceae bacterium]MDB4262184.1 hypothetical protein [Akkermansiaceae bacterium]MDB4267959.1 hypothetical protein [Akkermansiaceae bacterium]